MSDRVPSGPRRTFNYWLRLISFFIIALVLALNVVIGIRTAYSIAHPWRTPPCCLDPTEYAGLDFEAVSFLSRDGLNISGWYIPSKNGAAIVLSHGLGSNRSMTLPVAAILAEEGYGVLMIDLRAHGESEGELFTLWQAGDDVIGAAEYLQTLPEVDAGRIGAWGFSAGASASVHGAAQSEAIQVVVVDGLSWTRFKDARGLYHGPSYQYYLADLVQLTYTDLFYANGSQPRALVDDVALISPRPVLIIVNGQNPYGNELRAAEQYKNAGGETVDIWVVPDTVHGGGLDLYPEEYRQHLLDYFDRLLE